MASKEDQIVLEIIAKVSGEGADALEELGSKGEQALKKIETQANKTNAALARSADSQEGINRSIEKRGNVTAEQFQANKQRFNQETTAQQQAAIKQTEIGKAAAQEQIKTVEAAAKKNVETIAKSVAPPPPPSDPRERFSQELAGITERHNKERAIVAETAKQNEASNERAAQSLKSTLRASTVTPEDLKVNQAAFKAETERQIAERNKLTVEAEKKAAPTATFAERLAAHRAPPPPPSEAQGPDLSGALRRQAAAAAPALSGDAFGQLKTAFGQLETALGGIGISFGTLNTVMSAAGSGAVALAAAIGGVLLTAFGKATDSANDAKNRLGAFTGSLASGAKAFEQLEPLGKQLQVSATDLSKPFAELLKIGVDQPEARNVLANMVKSFQSDRVPIDKAMEEIASLFADLEKGPISADRLAQLGKISPRTEELLRKGIQQEAPGAISEGLIAPAPVLKTMGSKQFADDVNKNLQDTAQAVDSIPTAWEHLKTAADNLAKEVGGGTNIISEVLNAAAKALQQDADDIKAFKDAVKRIFSELGLDVTPKQPNFRKKADDTVAPFAAVPAPTAGEPASAMDFGTALKSTEDALRDGSSSLDSYTEALKNTSTATKEAATAQKEKDDQTQKLITGGTAIATRQRAGVNLQFLPAEQASQAEHNRLNVEKAGLAVEEAHLGAADAAKQMELASLSGAQAQIAAADASKQLALAMLAPMQAGVALASAENQLTQISQQNRLRRLQEAGIDQGPGTSAEGDLARQRIRQAQRDAQDIAEQQAEVAVEVAKVNLAFSGQEAAKARLAQQRAAIEIKYSGLDEQRAALAFKKAQIAIRSAALEESDASLKLLKDKALGPIDRDLALLHYQQALLDETKALRWLDPIYKTLQSILEALTKKDEKKSDEKKPGEEKKPVEEKPPPPQKFDPTKPLLPGAPPPGPDETDITINGQRFRVPKSKAPAAPEDKRTELERQQDKEVADEEARRRRERIPVPGGDQLDQTLKDEEARRRRKLQQRPPVEVKPEQAVPSPPERAPAQDKEAIKEFLKKGSGIVPPSMTREELLRQQGIDPNARVTTVDPNRPVPSGALPPAAHETDIIIRKFNRQLGEWTEETFRVLKSDQARGDAARKQMLQEMEQKTEPPKPEPPKPEPLKPPEVSPFTPPPLKPSDVVPPLLPADRETIDALKQQLQKQQQLVPPPPLTEPPQKPFPAQPLTEPVPKEATPPPPPPPPPLPQPGDPRFIGPIEPPKPSAEDKTPEVMSQLQGLGLAADTAKTSLEGIGTATETAKTAMDSVGQSVDTMKTAMDGVGTSVETMKTAMDGVGTSVETMKTSLNGVGTSVETMKTAMDGVGTATTTAKTALEGIGPAADAAKTALEGVGPAADAAKTGLDNVGTSANTASTALGSAATAATEFASAAQSAAARLASIRPGGGGGSTAPSAATGGLIRGPGSGTSDSIAAWLSHGEFVQSARATKFWGIDFMHALNNLQFPRFSTGGFAGLMSPRMPRFADGGFISENDNTPLTPHLGTVDLRTDHGSVTMMASNSAVEQLSRLAVTKRITSTGRKPGFVA